MTNSKIQRKNIPGKTISYSPLTISSTKVPFFLAVLILSFLGFLDATYLTIQHINGQIPPCTATHGCAEVLTSQFATLGPIPISAFGVGFFLVMMVLTLLYLRQGKVRILLTIRMLSSVAFVIGILLVLIQAFILQAFCQFCLFAEFLLTVIFITVWASSMKRFNPKLATDT